jgi:hypothetical protein
MVPAELSRLRMVALPSGVHGEPTDSPVAGIFATSHHAVFYQPIDESGHRRHRDLEERGELMPRCFLRDLSRSWSVL